MWSNPSNRGNFASIIQLFCFGNPEKVFLCFIKFLFYEKTESESYGSQS